MFFFFPIHENDLFYFILLVAVICNLQTQIICLILWNCGFEQALVPYLGESGSPAPLSAISVPSRTDGVLSTLFAITCLHTHPLDW